MIRRPDLILKSKNEVKGKNILLVLGYLYDSYYKYSTAEAIADGTGLSVSQVESAVTHLVVEEEVIRQKFETVYKDEVDTDEFKDEYVGYRMKAKSGTAPRTKHREYDIKGFNKVD